VCKILRMGMTTINEFRTNRLALDSKAYQRIYDLLEEHTFTWIVDAWKKNPTVDAIEELPLRRLPRQEATALANQHGLSEKKALDCAARRDNEALLRINDQTVIVTKDVAQAIAVALRNHVDQAG
jgi:hypothetical protein